MPEAADTIEALIDVVCGALADGEVAAARRHLVRARTRAGDSQTLGAIAGLELACERIDADDDAPSRERLRALAGETSEEPARFTSAVGCALSDLGERLDDARFLALADEWFRDATQVFIEPILFANHGVVLERLDRHADAADAFGRALDLDDTFHDLRRRRARCLAHARDLDGAAGEYRRYLAAHPDDAHEWISLAIVECDAGRLDDAEQAYWRAAGLEPNNLSLHYNWSISALRADGEDRARYALKRLEAIDPSDWRTHMARAQLVERGGDPAEAFRQIARVFLEIAEADDDQDTDPLMEHMASHLWRLGRRPELRAEAAGVLARLFPVRVFPESILDLLRELDDPQAGVVRDFAILIDALYSRADEPYACIVNYRVFAATQDEAGALAAAFERRCGAGQVHIDEGEDLGASDDEQHRGVWMRSNEFHYPAVQFDH
jgi:tetratricopeptide (TPR) repeat protein